MRLPTPPPGTYWACDRHRGYHLRPIGDVPLEEVFARQEAERSRRAARMQAEVDRAYAEGKAQREQRP